MNLYNVRTRQVEPLSPPGDAVTLYVCGITPYDTTHLGHIFTYASFDILIRALEYQGRTVRYAQNVTDIDDDILRKAREVGEDWQTLGNRWTVRFIEDLQALNVRPPDWFPRATRFIPDIITLVTTLLDRGLAYESGGNVYFAIVAWPDFGRLSGLDRDEMLPIANERGNFPDDPNKRDPLDFVLWQAQKPGEPAWESPWGAGRPGWHIECSTMAMSLLGETIDIHGGGADLCFPHHESEIAQSEGATGQRPFVRFWLHTAMVHHEGEKMSKSLGNLVMVRDLRQQWSPDALRLYLAGHHYRDAWSYDENRLTAAADLARQLTELLALPSGTGLALDAGAGRAAFLAALNDDLDTPTAVAILSRMAQQIVNAATAGANIRDAQKTIRELAGVLGLRLDAGAPEPRVVAGWSTYLADFAA